MSRKIYKKIHTDKGEITVYGSNRNLKLYWATPEWKVRAIEDIDSNRDIEEYFNYEGTRHYLSEFMVVEKHAPEWMHEFDGYSSDSFFSGVLVKIGYNDYGEEFVKAFTYIC